MPRYFVLRDGKVVEEQDHPSWLTWFESSYQQVARIAETRTDSATVSTRFLAVDLSLTHDDPPLLFETRVSGGWMDGECERYATPQNARLGHLAWVDRVRAAEAENELPPPGAGW